MIDNKYPKNNFIDKILWKFVIPNFNKLIIPIENSIIPSTNNKIRKYLPKNISKTYKKKNENRKRAFNKIYVKTKLLERE